QPPVLGNVKDDNVSRPTRWFPGMIVFVSSTYRDLAEHREIIRIALETSGFQFRGMEQFPAQQEPPLEVALGSLEECDVYVGIVGELYGSSPPGRVLSYTELEYNHAK